MSLKSIAAKIFAKFVVNRMNKWVNNPIETQEKVFRTLIATAAETSFGKDHGFHEIKSTADFAARVPIRDYEALKPYVERVVAGEEDVLWRKLPEPLLVLNTSRSQKNQCPPIQGRRAMPYCAIFTKRERPIL